MMQHGKLRDAEKATVFHAAKNSYGNQNPSKLDSSFSSLRCAIGEDIEHMKAVEDFLSMEDAGYDPVELLTREEHWMHEMVSD